MPKAVIDTVNALEARLFASPSLRDVLQYQEWLELRKAILKVLKLAAKAAKEEKSCP